MGGSWECMLHFEPKMEEKLLHSFFKKFIKVNFSIVKPCLVQPRLVQPHLVRFLE